MARRVTSPRWDRRFRLSLAFLGWDRRFRLSLLLVAATTCLAQPPRFEVASIRPNANPGHNNIEPAPGRLTMSSVSLNTCLKYAYHVTSHQIAGPPWIDTQTFDIVATALGATGQDVRPLVQTLLADRFKLALHHETRELAGFALTVAKDGPKFRESEGDGEGNMNGGRILIADRTNMAKFAELLSGPMRGPVVDQTGLKGRYDFKLDLTPFLKVGPEEASPDSVAVFRAAVGQLGLKLEPKKLPLDVLVIDHIEKIPTEN